MKTDRFRLAISKDNPSKYIIEDNGIQGEENGFRSAIPIEEYSSYLIGINELEETIVCFGLNGEDGEKSYYQCSPSSLATICHELKDVAFLASHIEEHETDEGFIRSHSSLNTEEGGRTAAYLGPLLKLERARQLLRELELISDQYARRVKPEALLVNKFVDYHQFELSYSSNPPMLYSLVLGDLIHNLRSALDLLINDVVRIRGEDTKDAEFPFSPTKEKLDAKLLQRNRSVQLGEKLIQLIKWISPCRDGNSELHSMHVLDIIDKHRLIIPIAHDVWFQLDTKKLGGDFRRLAGADNFNPIKSPEMPHIKSGDKFFCPAGQHPLQYIRKIEDPVALLFPPDAEDFSGKPILETCNSLIHLIGRIVVNISHNFPASDVGSQPSR